MPKGAKPKIIIHPVTGEETTYKAIASELGITTKALKLRIYRHGIEKAINNELFSKEVLFARKITHPITGETTTYVKLQKETGLADSTIRRRLQQYEAGEIEDWQVLQSGTPRTREQFTHPKTGVTGDAFYWSRELGLSPKSFRARIKNHGETLRSFIPHSRGQWSEEEDCFLCEVYEHPKLYSIWKRAAKKNKWKRRTASMIDLRINQLKKAGYIKSDRRYYEEDDEWISPNHLGVILCLSYATIQGFISQGLPVVYYSKTGRDRPRSKIKKSALVDWVLGAGKSVISDHLSVPSAVFWVLLQIEKYRNQ